MTISSHTPLQITIFQVLSEDASLASMVAGVYDRVPQGSAYPYIRLSKWEIQDWSSVSTRGMKHSLELQIWGRKSGMAQTAAIVDRIYTLLHQQAPSVSGHKIVLMEVKSTHTELGDDGSTYIAVMQLEALTQKTS